MIDETSTNWTFNEDEGPTPGGDAARESTVDQEPWASQLDPGLLMTFLSDFRGAMREKTASENAAARGRRDSAPSRPAPAQEPEPWEVDPYQGSDAPVTPEWWFATDGRWYPPELHPDRQVPIEPATEMCEPVAEVTPSVESVGKDRAVGKSFFARDQRKAGGFALEG